MFVEVEDVIVVVSYGKGELVGGVEGVGKLFDFVVFFGEVVE